MARLPLEDNYIDVIKKAQSGLNITDEQLAHRAEVSIADVVALKAGSFNEIVARRVARHLRLHATSLVEIANRSYYPVAPYFPTGFMAFNTPHGEGSVNNYVVWDERSKLAAIFDTGTDPDPVLEFVSSQKLRVQYLFVTHTDADHIAGLARIVEKTGAEVWSSTREPVPHPGAKTFIENATLHLGPFSIKTLFTWGHSPGGATYFIGGLSHPLAIIGDSLFAGSMGGASPESYRDAWDNNSKKILTLPANTVLACGHGPLTTVRQERKNNPFFVH